MLCAQNAFAAPLLAASAHKCYSPNVQGAPPPWGGRGKPPPPHPSRDLGRCVREDGKYSLTEYTVLAVGHSHSLAACYPRTGRTHQIRVHMAYIGHPLAGDTLYGGSDAVIHRHALHCGILCFSHPLTGQAPPRGEPSARRYGRTGAGGAAFDGWQLSALPCGAPDET